MITAIGKELMFDLGYSGTENLYYQLFGEWPEYDCLEMVSLLECYLKTLGEDSYCIKDFFGINVDRFGTLACGECKDCSRKAGCKYSEKGLVWLLEQVEAQLQYLRQNFSLEIKMLYLNYTEWGNADALRKYRQFALRALASTLTIQNLQSSLADTQVQLASQKTQNLQLEATLQERQIYHERLEAENELLIKNEVEMRVELAALTKVCRKISQDVEQMKALLEHTQTDAAQGADEGSDDSTCVEPADQGGRQDSGATEPSARPGSPAMIIV